MAIHLGKRISGTLLSLRYTLSRSFNFVIGGERLPVAVVSLEASFAVLLPSPINRADRTHS